MGEQSPLPASVDEALALLSRGNYVGERSLATVLLLALKLGRPLFLEGEAGVGKTEIAKVLAETLGRRLVRLQCYEGLDVSAAVYEWNYPRQMVEIRVAEAAGGSDREALASDIFDPRFLIERPLLQALRPDAQGAPVLLIDELDRTDEPFEAFLLEVLSDYQITIPELGTIAAAAPPIVIITSNRTREIHDALKRRCFYHWVDYPTAARELEILRVKAPEAPALLSQEIVAFVQALRREDLFKLPGIAETIDWAEALTQLDKVALDPQAIDDTLGVLLKYQDDIARIQGSEAARLLNEVKTELTGAAFA
ncbi:MoxR family ATPase [Pelagibius sp.]|uniref:AAA family ATPase n=1 Tax=Pelagibius sp. TaxID=1931238 RepID=UPI00262C3995|nr:MoxR family ATPase [Pelagibius sp.]